MNLNDKIDALSPPPPPPASPASPLSDINEYETRARFLGEKCAGVRQVCCVYSQFNLKG